MKNWMARHCVLIPVDDSMSGSMTEYASFNAQFQGSAGRKLLGDHIGMEQINWNYRDFHSMHFLKKYFHSPKKIIYL